MINFIQDRQRSLIFIDPGEPDQWELHCEEDSECPSQWECFEGIHVTIWVLGRGDCGIALSYVGGATFGQIMGFIPITYRADFPGSI